ncbi:MAG: carboxymuconolactone decarboxylase family protein [Methanolobus sp.]|nr:carboxymuconolactone decarboxylase family protein [Methanolobus sp.]
MNNTFGRKLYSLGEYYKIYYLALFSITDFRYAKKKKFLNEHFIERIMLAVTEVNGCPLCSFAHTKMALESGMSNEEIQNMLAGVRDDVPEEEISAVMFAQHYAETRGYPSKKSWERIVEIYGFRKAKGILGTIRMIMFGNAAGAAWGSFVNRLKKEEKADDRSNLLYEIGMILVTFIYLPIALIHTISTKLFRIHIIKFKSVGKKQ